MQLRISFEGKSTVQGGWIRMEHLRHDPGKRLLKLSTKTKVKSPQTNGVCERFHKTILDEFCV